MQTAWMAATTGLGHCSTARITVSRFGSASALGVLNSLMSAPPEKALPAPTSTTALTAGSAAARSSPATIPARTSCPSPLTGGASRVITATAPRVEYVDWLIGSP